VEASEFHLLTPFLSGQSVAGILAAIANILERIKIKLKIKISVKKQYFDQKKVHCICRSDCLGSICIFPVSAVSDSTRLGRLWVRFWLLRKIHFGL